MKTLSMNFLMIYTLTPLLVAFFWLKITLADMDHLTKIAASLALIGYHAWLFFKVKKKKDE